MAKFEIFQDEKNQWRWHLKAANGKIIADSAEGYVRKSDCEHGISLIKKLAPQAEAVTVQVVTARMSKIASRIESLKNNVDKL